MEAVQILALTLGIGWASGINLYAAVFMLGLMQNTGNLALPPDLLVLSDPWVMGAAGLMYCIEFFADKLPGVDTGWDTIHTFIRIPAGAVLAAGAVGEVSPGFELAAGLLGGAFAAGSHVTKAGTRVLINASPEPFTNWTASLTEDVAVVAGLWTALYHPWVFLSGLGVFLLVLVFLLPRIARGIRALGRRIVRLFGGGSAEGTEVEIG